MIKQTGRTEYRSKAKTIRILLALMLLAVSTFCLSACITVQTPDNGGTETPPVEQPVEEPPATDDSGIGDPNLSEEEAVQIVLDKVGGGSKEDILSFGLDYDDGRWNYEGKIRNDGVIYEFEIDGQTGNILEWEIDD